jgi:hypothetical protein
MGREGLYSRGDDMKTKHMGWITVALLFLALSVLTVLALIPILYDLLMHWIMPVG